MKRKFLLLTYLLIAITSLHAEVKVTDVAVKPRWPWNGLVDITYSIECDEKDDEGKPKDVYVDFTGIDNDRNITVKMKSLTGQGAKKPVKAGGPYTVTWNMGKDEPNIHSSSFQVDVQAITAPSYMVINLETWEVRYTNQPPNFDDDTCRTTELWLRKIPAGTFTMGSPENEVGREDGVDMAQHQVTITQMFYIGVFECTQKQWELVMGNKPSYFSNATYYATRPVEQVSYNMIRGTGSQAGAGWPTYGHAVDSTSFMGKLQEKTGLTFDLPTEAQWEYACRAGTTTALNSGKNLTSISSDANMAEVGRHMYNGGLGYSQNCDPTYGTAKVGSYLPNAWGLYDMHGNVYEWCLDWWGESTSSTAAETDPVGPNVGSSRVFRGGGLGSYSRYCRSAYRCSGDPSDSFYCLDSGFRIFCLFLDRESEDTMRSAAVRINGRTSVGGRIIHGTQWISPVAENANDTAKLMVNGFAADGWTVGNPQFDSRKEEDGWHGFVLNEGTKNVATNLLILNDDCVVIHGGVLTANETWAADKIHVVRNWVRIPEGRTLTVATDAVVKFCENTGIQVDGTIKANHAIFTSIADDMAGGDTDMNGETADVGYGLYDITGNGTKILTDCNIRFAARLPGNTTWKAGDVIHVMGVLTVPSGVTLTIQSGAIVKFATGTELKADGGSISANGAMFTHLADDSAEAGGDTNSDGDATSPVNDAYKLTGFSPSADCELRYITLTYAGGTIYDTKHLLGNRVHKVTGNITIVSGGKLIVQPGAIVKMEAGLSINIENGGTLEALGNRAQPIVFTSSKDDEHGGDTNDDGNLTIATAGDWKQITIAGGTADMDFCHILYPEGSNNQGGIYISSGTVNFSNGEISHTVYDCVRSSGNGTFINSIFTDSSMGVAPRGGNNVIINCIFYDITTMVRWSSGKFYNCVFMHGIEFIDSKFYSSTVNMPMYNCIFWNEAGFDGQTSCPKTGFNGNVWANPLFNDPENGDFTLQTGSPCIDAGDGTVAPELDYFGQPRQNIQEVVDTGTEAANGAVPDIGIHEMLPKNSKSDVDLAITDLDLSQNELEIGKEFTLSWTVANLGNRATNTTWRDRVYLVTSSKKEYEIGTYLHTTNIAPNGMQTVQGTFGIPVLNEGTCRICVRINSDRDIYEGTLVDNNVAYSDEVLCYIPNVEENRYDGKVFSGENILKLALDGNSANIGRIRVPKGTIVLTGNGFVPEMNHYDSRLMSNSDELLFEIPNGCETLYLLIQASQDGPCELELFHGDMQIGNIEPNVLPCNGMTSVVVSGVGFHDVLSVEATTQDGNATIAAKSVRQISAEQLLVTFDCSDFSAGEQYGILVTTETSLASVQNAFAVSWQNGEAKIVAHLSVPDTIRQGRKYVCKLEYENIGNIDALVPIFEIEVQGEGTLTTIDGMLTNSNTLSFIGAGKDQTAGIIRPGESFVIPFIYIAGRNDKILLRSSIDKDYYVNGWSNSLNFSKDVSEATYRIGLRAQDATNYKTVIDMAEKIRDNIEIGAAVFGKLLDSNKMPVSEMLLSIYSDENCETLIATTMTSNNGNYCFSELDEGTYYMVPACIPSGTSSSYLEKNRYAFHVDQSQNLKYDIELKGLLSIVGFINDEENYHVNVIDLGSGDKFSFEASKKFKIYGWKSGWYYIELSNGKKGQKCWIDFSNGETQVHRFSPSWMYTLNGFVDNYNELSDQLENAIVRAESEQGDVYLSCLDSNGNFSFDDLIIGKYEISLANCSYTGVADIELKDDTYFVSISAEFIEQDDTRNADLQKSSYKPVLRSLSLWDEFWETYSEIAQIPFEEFIYEPWFNSIDRNRQKYLDLDLTAFRLSQTYTAPVPPTGEYNCEHNQNKFVNDRYSYNMFILYQRRYSDTVQSSDPYLAIAEGSKLAGMIGDAAFDFVAGGYIGKLHKWQKIAMELIVYFKENVELILDIIDFCYKTGTDLGNGNLNVSDFISKEDEEWIKKFDLLPYEGMVLSSGTTAEKVEGIVRIINTGKRIERMLRGIIKKQKLLQARGYNISKLSNCLYFVSLLGDLIRFKTQAQEASDRIFTSIFAIRDLDELYQKMQIECRDYPSIAKNFNNYPLCCETPEPEPEPDIVHPVKVVMSCDPNEISGIVGVGDSGTQRFVKRGEELTYTIYFENKADAEAAAQEVRVMQELSNWLDWSTFQIMEVGFNNQIDMGLAGKSDGMSEISLDGTSWKVRSEVELNQKKGIVNCYLRIVDESTEDGWPEDPYAGFLPPNDDNHTGEGYIRYKIKVRGDAPTGVRIDAEATIVFDYNDPITTSPAWFNWIGAENGVQPETGYLTWDLVDGATYQVTIWTGEADAEERNVVASSGALTENRWRLPTSLQNDTVYFWQVTTTAADGTVTESPVWGFDLGGRCTLELKPGWNLFSLPFRPESYTERILLGHNLFGIENNSYTRTSSLEGGKAYWLFQRDNIKRYLDIFPSQTRVTEEIPLKVGWNMVGPTDTERYLPAGYTIWYWQNGRFAYLEEDAEGGYTLKAGVGYWVYMP